MKRTLKKVIAILCAVAMIVSSVTIYNNTASAAEDSAPIMAGNPLIQLNDFGAGEVLYVAGLDVIKNATSYNLYVDGTLWGSVTNGANLEITSFASGSHLFQVTGVNTAGESEKSAGYTIVIPAHEAVVDPEITDGTELLQGLMFTDVDTTTDESSTESLWMELSQDGSAVYTNNGDGSVSIGVSAYDSGDNWATQLKQNNVSLVKDKWYVAKCKITSDVDKKIQLLVQHNANWAVFAEKIVSVSAGATEDVELVFQASQTTNKVLFGFMMGYVDNTACEAANITISDVSLTVYNSNPNGDVEESTTSGDADESASVPDESASVPDESASELDESTSAPDESVTDPTEESESATEQTGQREETEAAGFAELAYEAFLAGEVGANQYKAICGKGSINGIINIQQYGAATEAGIYVSFKDADIGEITVNGEKAGVFVDGAGAILYLSNFKYMYSDVVVMNGNGTQKAVIYVYNAQGIDNSDKAIEKESTTSQSEGPKQQLTLQQVTLFGRYVEFGSYKVMRNENVDAYVGIDPENRDHIQVQNATGPSTNTFMVSRAYKGLTKGTKYVLSVDVTPSVANGSYKTMTGTEYIALQEGTTTISMVSTAYEVNGVCQADFTLYLNNLGADVVLDIDNPQYREATEEDLTTQNPTSKEEEPATSETDPTSKEEEPSTKNEPAATVPDVTKDSPEKTTEAPKTSEQNATTTVSDDIVKVTSPAKANVTKVTAKKKSSKKMKLSLKKVEGAKGYQIAVYTTKKNAKKNKNAIVKKIVNKTKVTVTSKKLKNKKKLFVKVRAYVLNEDGEKVYGKWSKVKKVKVK